MWACFLLTIDKPHCTSDESINTLMIMVIHSEWQKLHKRHPLCQVFLRGVAAKVKGWIKHLVKASSGTCSVCLVHTCATIISWVCECVWVTQSMLHDLHFKTFSSPFDFVMWEQLGSMTLMLMRVIQMEYVHSLSAFLLLIYTHAHLLKHDLPTLIDIAVCVNAVSLNHLLNFEEILAYML